MKRVAFALSPAVKVVICRPAAALVALCALLGGAPAWASHPLLTEDTGVLGKGVREFELHGERSRGDGSRGTEALVKLGYGVGATLDAEVELPYAREVDADGTVRSGRGDAGVAVKWRFYESRGFSLAVKPGLLLPTGRDENGLGAGRTRWSANFAAAYELGRVELIAHLGYTDNRNRIGEIRSLRHQSIAVRFEATEKLRLVVDVARDSSPDPASRGYAREVVYGGAYALSDDVDLGLGFKKGLNDRADDRGLRAGVKLRW